MAGPRMVKQPARWYAPEALAFARTIGGRVKTGMGDADWDVLLRRIRNKTCTPFLGAGASAHILPTAKDLADRWAKEAGYPLPEQGDLAQVAQYMAIAWDPLSPKERISDLCKAIDPAKDLQPGDPYDIIAGLELPVYITTNYDDLLFHALHNKGKEPKVLLCPWHNSLTAQARATWAYDPSPEGPVIYHLHGSAKELGSIVITEDDYLDFIVWVSRQWSKQASVSFIATAVKTALARNSLLFIGYSQNDWSFRVLMRSIRQTGVNLGARHVAVQLSPLGADATEVDQEKVAAYLTKYFTGIQSNNPVSLYWGTANDFLKDLRARLAGTEGS